MRRVKKLHPPSQPCLSLSSTDGNSPHRPRGARRRSSHACPSRQIVWYMYRDNRPYSMWCSKGDPQAAYHASTSFSIIAAVYSDVDALPPRSPVIVLPSAIVLLPWRSSQRTHLSEQTGSPTVSAAFSILSAYWLRFMCLPETRQRTSHNAGGHEINGPQHHERRK